MRKSSLVLAAVLSVTAASPALVPASGGAQGLGSMFSEVSPTYFVQQAVATDEFAVGASRIALLRTTHPQIRELAEMLIRDHTASNTELKALPEGSTRVTGTALDETRQRKLVKLTDHLGDDFNRWYVQMMVEEHRDAVRLYRAYAENGEVPMLKAFAQKHLPRLELHGQQARSLQVRPS
jgi:putative membrane protein